MISVQEARQLILQNSNHSKPASLSLAEANGYILSADVFALNDAPPFDQSAMDGYAFSFKDWDGQSALAIAGAIPAGCFSTDQLQPSTAIRIFTAPFKSPIGDFTIGGTIAFLAQHESYDIGQAAYLKKYFTKEAMSYSS